ncbi:YceI family protein [Flavihumibacter sp. RY-1]|uniref:YceI family protein n=1 Tax=Flavihumibacter fluminis TaxID=2909236 RepID=A0ABS9BIM1_9BACT|nr:YceI family protein [Flavihumibacter fluminis]MCF1714878.1 YceI family protein [Flavihumibacter fluminis]
MVRILFVFCMLVPYFLVAQALHPVDTPGAVSFIINNFGSGVDGSFKGLKGEIRFDPTKLTESNMNVTVDAVTIETGINMRNRHLRGEKYFYVDKFPVISILGTQLKSAGKPDTYNMTARVTIKGVSKTFSLTFTAKPQKNGFFFEGSFTLNRRDFNIGSGSISLADEVTVRLKVLAQ